MYPLRLSTAPALRKLRTAIRRQSNMVGSTCPIMVVDGDSPPMSEGEGFKGGAIRVRGRIVRSNYKHSTLRIVVGMGWKWDGEHSVAETLALLAMAAQ